MENIKCILKSHTVAESIMQTTTGVFFIKIFNFFDCIWAT